MYGFLKVSLNSKLGVTRNVKIAQHVFENFSVYKMVGISVHSLSDSYCNSFDVANCIGRYLLFDVVKMIIKIGETKVGLSTCYISLE